MVMGLGSRQVNDRRGWTASGVDLSYPVRISVAPAAERQSRLKALFRLILALPMPIVSSAVNCDHLGAAIVTWLTIA